MWSESAPPEHAAKTNHQLSLVSFLYTFSGSHNVEPPNVTRGEPTRDFHSHFANILKYIRRKKILKRRGRKRRKAVSSKPFALIYGSTFFSLSPLLKANLFEFLKVWKWQPAWEISTHNPRTSLEVRRFFFPLADFYFMHYNLNKNPKNKIHSL